MKSRALAIATAVVVAGHAQAQTIVARSGEHEDFTRIVMRIPDGLEWSLTQSGRMATVNVGSPSVVFNTQSVFNLIPRTRVQDVRQDGPGQPLRIDLGCECTVDYYKQSNGYLVVDVREGGLPLDTATASVPDTRQVLPLPLNSTSYRFNLGQPDLASARVAMDLANEIENAIGSSSSTPLPDGPIQLPLITESALLGRNTPSSLTPEPQNEERQERAKAEVGKPEANNPNADAGLLMDFDEGQRTAMINDSEHRLLEQINRASGQGLIQTVDQAEENGLLDPRSNEDRPLNPLDNINVTTAIDRESGLLALQSEDMGKHEYCIDNRKLSIEKWADERPFSTQLGEVRGTIMGEFDNVNRDETLKLARLYLYFGFGAEAKATLNIIPEDRLNPETREILSTMADILDSQPLPVNTIFTGQQTCPGDAAFWAAMSDGIVKKSANRDAIQQTFARLPAHLRALMGARVTTWFAEAGAQHEAEVSMRAVERAGIEEVPEKHLAEAALARLHGDTDGEARNLTQEVAKQSENAPRALIDLIELSYRERKALTPDVPELAASYELQSRETPLGVEMRRAEMISLALAGRFEEAFETFDKIETRDGPSARDAANEPLMRLLTENADDVTFLKHALLFAEEAGATRALQVGTVVARRLLDLGFPEEAELLLQKLSLEPADAERRLMNAEAHLAQQRPQQALVELMGLEGQQADRIRARALWLNKEFERASEYMLSNDDVNDAARGFWYSEDLQAAEALDGNAAPFRSVAELTNQIGEAVEGPQGLTPLAEAQALVESSIGARESIEELLRQVETQNAISQ